MYRKKNKLLECHTWIGSVIRNNGMNAGKTCLEKSASEAFSAISIMLGSTNGTMLLLPHSVQRLGNTLCMFTRWTYKDQHASSIKFIVIKKVKVAHTRLPRVGFQSSSRFLAVSQQVAWIINPTVDCHQFCCLVNRGTMGVNNLPKTVTQQRRDCDLKFEPGPSAPAESSMLTTRLPSHNIQ